jgi:hypothetical protein
MATAAAARKITHGNRKTLDALIMPYPPPLGREIRNHYF